jgi:hypothetical protein
MALAEVAQHLQSAPQKLRRCKLCPGACYCVQAVAGIAGRENEEIMLAVGDGDERQPGSAGKRGAKRDAAGAVGGDGASPATAEQAEKQQQAAPKRRRAQAAVGRGRGGVRSAAGRGAGRGRGRGRAARGAGALSGREPQLTHVEAGSPAGDIIDLVAMDESPTCQLQERETAHQQQELQQLARSAAPDAAMGPSSQGRQPRRGRRAGPVK